MLGFLPIFTLEDGKLNPVEKVKNIRSGFDYFIDILYKIKDCKHFYRLTSIEPDVYKYKSTDKALDALNESFKFINEKYDNGMATSVEYNEA